MYPNLSYILHALIGTERDNFLSIVQTFGLFLALGTIAAAVFLRWDMMRRTELGQFTPTKVSIRVGEPAGITDLIGSGFVGFLLGWKLPPLFAGVDVSPPDFILSSQGNILTGILGAAAFAGYTWWDGQKEAKKYDAPKSIPAVLQPWHRTSDIAIIAALSGIVGAKVFGIFEVPPSSISEFFTQFFSGQGLAIYGGLIAGFFGVWFYMKKNNLAFWPLADAIAPGMLIGVGVGRIGCQLSGDGDWGIDNLNPTPDWWFFPDWMWAYRYPHNVINNGIPIPGCEVEHCMQLANPVYPTPFYEIIMLIGLGLLLWSIRKWAGNWPGLLMGLYLIANGVERFLIEKIRVNAVYDFMGFQPTQAEIISVVSILLGLALCISTMRKGKREYSLSTNPW